MYNTYIRKQVFSTQGETYRAFECDLSPRSTDFTYEEYLWAIKSRLSIILVCKLWYTIGVTLLWSDLRINFAASSHYIQAISAMLHNNPGIASRIRRLELASQFGYSFDSSKTGSILGDLPALKILTCSITSQDIPDHIQLDVLILRRDQPRRHFSIRVQTFWQNVRVLLMTFREEHVASYSPDQLLFPRLEFLRVVSDRGNIANCISSYWETPSLRFLSINGALNDESYWLIFLNRNSGMLEKIQINIQISRESAIGIPIPVLHRVHTIYVCSRSSLLFHFIKSPNLWRVGVFGSMHDPSKLFDYLNGVNGFLTIFPTVKEVSLGYANKTYIYIYFRWEITWLNYVT